MKFYQEEQYGAYGSHSPLLKSLNELFKIESVIEFGLGEASTKLFLGWSNLKSLTSFEHDANYAEQLKTIQDERWNLILCPHSEFLSRADGMRADLVFVDSGPTMDTRKDVLSGAINLGDIIALHDYDYQPYFDYFNAYKYVYKYPRGATVALSNVHDLSKLEEYLV